MALQLGVPRDEMLARMTSEELSGWMVLFDIHAEEQEDRRHQLESGDGQVFISGRDADDEEESDDGGETE